MIVVRMVTGVLLAAHGLVHLLYLASDVPEFSLDRCWLVPKGARGPLALGPMAATVGGFALLALAVWSDPGLSAAWPALTVVAGLLSAVLLLLFWDIWLLFGLAIDLTLVAVAVTHPHGAARGCTAHRRGRLT